MLPNQPMILLSFINTKLRDDYASLDELCEDFRVPRDEIEEKLLPKHSVDEKLGFLGRISKSPDKNRFCSDKGESGGFFSRFKK